MSNGKKEAVRMALLENEGYSMEILRAHEVQASTPLCTQEAAMHTCEALLICAHVHIDTVEMLLLQNGAASLLATAVTQKIQQPRLTVGRREGRDRQQASRAGEPHVPDGLMVDHAPCQEHESHLHHM